MTLAALGLIVQTRRRNAVDGIAVRTDDMRRFTHAPVVGLGALGFKCIETSRASASTLPPGRYQVVLEAAAGRDLRSLFGSSLTSPAPEVTGERIVTRFSVAPRVVASLTP